jgi:hypothetical protein
MDRHRHDRLAISLIESRLKKAFPEDFGEAGPRQLRYEVIGTPKDLESARDNRL